MAGDRLAHYLHRLEQARPLQLAGRVRAVTGLLVRAIVPNVRLGELVAIEGNKGPLVAEVVGLEGETVFMLPLGDLTGIGPDSRADGLGEPLTIKVGSALLGRVLDGLGRPIDGRPPEPEGDLVTWPVMRPAPNPLTRRRIERALPLGVRAIDALLTVGEGQRIGLFSGPGLGKSALMGQIARNSAAEVVVICLVGERGREVRDFLEDALGAGGLQRSVVVVATSDEPPLVRLKSAYTATAIAEYFREQGFRVLLMMDSVTRFARAQRDVGLAVGELPARHGYPPSVFSSLPQLLERSGNGERGTMTAIYTVLVAGDDLNEPIADEVRGILDGHIVLDRRLAERGHWPAINVLQSLSRVMASLVSPEQAGAARSFRRILSLYESKRDLISLGAYRYGTDIEVDQAIDHILELESFLRQEPHQQAPFEDSVHRLLEVVPE
ncbi:MAG: FliI/YscN family ATPase [Bradymonadales bacterium]|nr:FliI/YscN family ATPase [Bradymonadales bacterium]